MGLHYAYVILAVKGSFLTKKKSVLEFINTAILKHRACEIYPSRPNPIRCTLKSKSPSLSGNEGKDFRLSKTKQD